MHTLRETLRLASALALTAALVQCDSKGTSDPADLSVSDLGVPQAPDLAAPAATDLALPARPVLASIGPPTAPTSGGTLLTLSGSGFLSGTTVTVGGSACPTSSVSAQQITCVLPARTAGCGPAAVVVSSPDGTVLTDGTSFSYRTARIGFGSLINVPNAGSNSRILAVADWNGDGKLDVANTNVGANTVSVRTGNGDGTFNAVTTVNVSSAPGQLAVGDFNGDNRPDLAVARIVDNLVMILLGNGDGTFKVAGAPVYSTGSGASSIGVGDLNGDMKLDLAVAGDYMPGTVTILLGNGDGTFKAATPSVVTVGALPQVAELRDMTGDGKLDLIALNTSSNSVSLLPGKGDGSFAAGAAAAVGMRPLFMIVRDLNGDRKLDVATGDLDSNVVSIRLGDGLGGLGGAAPSSTLPLADVLAMDTADFDGDGVTDLAAAAYRTGTLSVLSGKGDGTFVTPASNTFALNTQAHSMAVADFNGDKIPDVIATSNNTLTLSLRLGQCQ